MRRILAGLITGLLFGAGLALAGLTDPNVILGFLDVAGAWNPSVLVVMAVAVAVTFIGYRAANARGTPLWGGALPPAPTRVIDTRLIGGAALFGIGWGLAGYCPGPALASLSSGNGGVIAFVAAMAIAMTATRLTLAKRR